jgi:hypothetical protein
MARKRDPKKKPERADSKQSGLDGLSTSSAALPRVGLSSLVEVAKPETCGVR